jgi:hypothetical protein
MIRVCPNVVEALYSAVGIAKRHHRLKLLRNCGLDRIGRLSQMSEWIADAARRRRTRLFMSGVRPICEMVPAEGFEPPTYGLQNRCTTTVLSRRGAGSYYSEPGLPAPLRLSLRPGAASTAAEDDRGKRHRDLRLRARGTEP